MLTALKIQAYSERMRDSHSGTATPPHTLDPHEPDERLGSGNACFRRRTVPQSGEAYQRHRKPIIAGKLVWEMLSLCLVSDSSRTQSLSMVPQLSAIAGLSYLHGIGTTERHVTQPNEAVSRHPSYMCTTSGWRPPCRGWKAWMHHSTARDFRAPLEQDVEDLGVLVHEPHARPVRIAVHAEDAPANLRTSTEFLSGLTPAGSCSRTSTCR